MAELFSFINPWSFSFIAVLITGSAFLQGVGGVGFTMFVAPIALMVFPELVPGPLLTLGGLVTFLTAAREHHHIMWPATKLALTGRVLGTAIAIFILSYLSLMLLNIVFAGLILVAVALSVSGLKISPTRVNLGIAGLFSGVMGTLTSVGAPPLAIAMQHSSPANIRATIGSILALGSMVSIIGLAFANNYGVVELALTISMIPFLFFGFWLSNHARGLVSGPTLRKALLMFCTISALSLILKTIFGL